MASLKDLEKKYDSFIKPIMYIQINGKKIDSKILFYKTIEVVSTIGFESSVCRISASEVSAEYKDNKLTLESDVYSIFKMGSKLELFIGYGEDTNALLVFVGFITNIGFELENNNNVKYHIEAMDLKVFMMNNMRSELKKDMTKYSEVVVSVLKNYSSLFSEKNIEDTPTLASAIEQHNQSDYQFVVNMAKKSGYLFFVDRGEVKFIKYSSAKEKCIAVSPCIALYSFTKDVSIASQINSVVVRSHDEEDIKVPIEGTAKSPYTVGSGTKVAADISKLISDSLSLTIIDNSVHSVKEAEERAMSALVLKSMSLVSGEVEMIGIPDVFAGGILTVEEITDDINGDYLIKEVIHHFQDNKYTTTCKFGANKL